MNDNNNEPEWNSYRLSLSHMQSLSNHSTHLRVTCNLPADGLQYTDYARAVLAGHDIFGDWGGDCKLFEYINIRGINCSDCTAYTRMDLNGAWFVNSFKSKENVPERLIRITAAPLRILLQRNTGLGFNMNRLF